MNKYVIDYSELVDEVMHIIVKKSLMIISDNTYCGDHHFFISFITNYPGVILSPKLRKKYPGEMTIVLQYQFEDLKVDEDYFSVVLSFDNLKEKIVIPFKSLTAFADPSVKFGLQFRSIEENHSNREIIPKEEPKAPKEQKTKVNNEEKDNIIAFDSFRKKK